MHPLPLRRLSPARPPHPPCHHRAAGWALCAAQGPTSCLFDTRQGHRHQSQSPPLPRRVYLSILCVSFSTLACKLSSSVPFSRFRIYMLIYDMHFSVLTLLCVVDSRSIHVSTNDPFSFLSSARKKGWRNQRLSGFRLYYGNQDSLVMAPNQRYGSTKRVKAQEQTHAPVVA